MSFEVKGKIALVTGANRGIGKAIVEALLKHGATKVYAGVRSLERAEPLVAEYGARIVPVSLDLLDAFTIEAAAEQAHDVEIVVNNAGILEPASPLEVRAVPNLRKELDVNVFGLIRMARAFAPVLERNGGGAFVQLNTVASIKNFTPFTTYSASKAAAYSITQGLRQGLAAQGTRVLSVHPGPIDTAMAHKIGLGAGAAPASVVGEGIVASLRAGDFHFFAGAMAEEVWSAYESFATRVVEEDLAA